MPPNGPRPDHRPSWTDVVETCRTAGAAAGASAAEWWAQDTVGGRATGDTRTRAARVLAGLDDIDPVVVDTLPACHPSDPDADTRGLYGEHAPAGAPDWDDLDDTTRDEIADAYRDGYDTAVHDRVAAACRAVLDDGPPRLACDTTWTGEAP